MQPKDPLASQQGKRTGPQQGVPEPEDADSDFMQAATVQEVLYKCGQSIVSGEITALALNMDFLLNLSLTELHHLVNRLQDMEVYPWETLENYLVFRVFSGGSAPCLCATVDPAASSPSTRGPTEGEKQAEEEEEEETGSKKKTEESEKAKKEEEDSDSEEEERSASDVACLLTTGSQHKQEQIGINMKQKVEGKIKRTLSHIVSLSIESDVVLSARREESSFAIIVEYMSAQVTTDVEDCSPIIESVDLLIAPKNGERKMLQIPLLANNASVVLDSRQAARDSYQFASEVGGEAGAAVEAAINPKVAISGNISTPNQIRTLGKAGKVYVILWLEKKLSMPKPEIPFRERAAGLSIRTSPTAAAVTDQLKNLAIAEAHSEADRLEIVSAGVLTKDVDFQIYIKAKIVTSKQLRDEKPDKTIQHRLEKSFTSIHELGSVDFIVHAEDSP